MSNAWFENYKRRMTAQRAASPAVSLASTVSNGSANDTLKRRNDVYTRKISNWKSNVAAGKVNVAPRPTHRNQNKLTREEFRRRLMENSKPPVEPVFSNVAQWRPLAQNNSTKKAQKKADLAAYFAAMKAAKPPPRNVRHTTGRASRKNRKTRCGRK